MNEDEKAMNFIKKAQQLLVTLDKEVHNIHHIPSLWSYLLLDVFYNRSYIYPCYATTLVCMCFNVASTVMLLCGSSKQVLLYITNKY